MDIRDLTFKDTDIFHVHTYRCGHAQNCTDEEYVQKAISIGATGIVFTDHVPFPDNPFGLRMRMYELDDYILSLKQLRDKYAGQIKIMIGLEIEYFPKYFDYYQSLKANSDIQILMLGQHMYDLPDGEYSFSLSHEILRKEEYLGLGKNIIAGIKTGIFSIVAHPDRIFRKHHYFGDDEYQISDEIIRTAMEHNVALEINKASVDTGFYVPEFWKIASQYDTKIVYGLDAHSLNEVCLWKYTET